MKKNRYSECPIHKQFVSEVLHRCVDLGWRDNKLAEKAGISQSHWSEIRNGKKSPSIETLFRIAHAVGLELDFRLSASNRIV